MSYPHLTTECWEKWPVITLCGSMRFYKQMLTVAADLTLKNHVVLIPFCVVEEAQQDSMYKEQLDMLHRRKIDMSWKVIVVSDGGRYIGDSTRKEIDYAKSTTNGKENPLYVEYAIVLEDGRIRYEQ